MMCEMLWRQFVSALFIIIMLTGICGFVFPLTVGLLAWPFSRHPATYKTSLEDLMRLEKYAKSRNHFRPRPSQTIGYPYNVFASGFCGAPLSGPLGQRVILDRLSEGGIKKEQFPAIFQSVPDLFFASASGLDPHITVQSAWFQLDQIATSRGIDKKILEKFLASFIEKTPNYEWLFFPHVVNVLHLNQALDELALGVSS